MSPAGAAARISSAAHALVAEQYRVLNEELLPALATEGIRFLKRSPVEPRQAQWVRASSTASCCRC
jgi:polyphosphate kinase